MPARRGGAARDARAVRREPAAAAGGTGRAPRIGTSSVRRIAQLHRQFPGAEFLPVRGNVDTRLRKLDAGEYDALVLAAAGLHRLDRGGRISGCLPVDACIPAPGQGIVAVECREDAEEVTQTLVAMSDAAADVALRVERAIVAALGGGCQLPLGAHCRAHRRRHSRAACVRDVDRERPRGARHRLRRQTRTRRGWASRSPSACWPTAPASILDAVREYDGPLPDTTERGQDRGDPCLCADNGSGVRCPP